MGWHDRPRTWPGIARTIGWVRISFVNQLGVAVMFLTNSPSMAELMAARKLRPELSDEPPARFRDRIRDGQLDMGVLPGIEARRICERASSLGLNVQTSVAHQGVYVFQDCTAGGFLIVEDDIEAERVAQEMTPQSQRSCRLS